MFAGMVCVFATSGLALANPWVIRYGIDSLSEEITREGLVFYAGLIVGLTILQGHCPISHAMADDRCLPQDRIPPENRRF